MQLKLADKIHERISSLLKFYNANKEKSLKDIIDLHHKFETIHPFHDGNGRVGQTSDVQGMPCKRHRAFHHYRGTEALLLPGTPGVGTGERIPHGHLPDCARPVQGHSGLFQNQVLNS